MRKLIQIIVLGLSVIAMPAAASEEEALVRCEQLEELVVKRSATDIAPTRRPLVRHYVPKRNYIWCLGIGFAQLGKDERAKAVILSFGREPDGSLWLDFWEKRKTPAFKWAR